MRERWRECRVYREEDQSAQLNTYKGGSHRSIDDDLLTDLHDSVEPCLVY